MNLYTILSSGLATHEATDLSARLSAWHDSMVAHERKLRAGTASDPCDDECAHADARRLWAEALETFGARAQGLVFLRSRAQETRRMTSRAASTDALAAAADSARRRTPQRRPATSTTSPAGAAAEM